MHSVMKFEGLMDRILDEAVRQGLAKTKMEAVRMGVIELDNKYNLTTEALEDREDIAYIRSARKKIASGSLRLRSEAELHKILKG